MPKPSSPLAQRLRARARRARQRWQLLRPQLEGWFSRRTVTGDAPVVVSLTTHGKRLAAVHATIESIASGTVRPHQLLLWLNPADADGKTLPSALRHLRRRGLDIRIAENHGPHTKYFPYVQSVAKHEWPLVTADDDVIYPPSWLEGLLLAHRAHPDAVNCYRARRISLRDAALAPYNDWGFATSTDASFLNFATGVSGVIYPPALLDALREAGPKFKDCCPRADDVWLHASALRHGLGIRQIAGTAQDFGVTPQTQHLALYLQNATEDGNDPQIRATYSADDLRLLAARSLAEAG